VTGGLAVALAAVPAAGSRAQEFVDLRQLGNEAVKTVAVGAAVKAAAKPLNQFINTVTLRFGVQDKQSTKVVPILSVGDKGYVGGAQVSGPAASIAKTQVVWQLEGSKKIGDGVYRVKALMPSNSLNPLKLTRVQKVGVNAIIDVATGGAVTRDTYVSKDVRGTDVLKAGAIAVAVNAAAKPINQFVNTVTLNKNGAGSTKVVPMATLGEKAYVGAGQLSGSTTTLPKAKALWQYDDLFDRGRFRVKILVPTDGINPAKLRRVQGVGMSALIDTTIARQYDTVTRRDPRDGGSAGRSVPLPVGGVFGDRDRRDDGDGGKAPGWRRHWEGVDPRDMPPGIAKKFGFPKHGGEDNDGDRGRGRGKGKGRGKHGDD
jgi:hypothetical protein